MKKIVLCVGMAAGLAACGTPSEPITQPMQTVLPINPETSRGLDVFASARDAGQDVPDYKGLTDITIRTYVRQDDTSTEVVGAECDIVGSNLYELEATTPVVIQVPVFGSRSPSFTAFCEYEGLSLLEQVEPFNQSAADRWEAGGRAGLIGVLVTATVEGIAGERENDVWAYPDISLTLR